MLRAGEFRSTLAQVRFVVTLAALTIAVLCASILLIVLDVQYERQQTALEAAIAANGKNSAAIESEKNGRLERNGATSPPRPTIAGRQPPVLKGKTSPTQRPLRARSPTRSLGATSATESTASLVCLRSHSLSSLSSSDVDSDSKTQKKHSTALSRGGSSVRDDRGFVEKLYGCLAACVPRAPRVAPESPT